MKNKLMEFWTKYQTFIWPIIGGGISISLLMLVIIPQILKVLDTNKEIENTKQNTTVLNKKASDLKQIDVTEYKNYFNKLSTVLPAQLNITSAISQIQSLTASSNTQIISFSVRLPATEIDAEGFGITVELKGSKESVKNFIGQIKNAPRLMTINNIDLTSDKTGLIFDASLNIQTYSQKQKTTLSGIEDKISLLSDSEKGALEKLNNSVSTIPLVSEDTITGPKGKSNPFE